MVEQRKYRSDALAAIHETAEGLHKIGAIDKATMRKFDEAATTAGPAATDDFGTWLIAQAGRLPEDFETDV